MPLPDIDSFNSDVSESEYKSAFSQLRSYLSGLLGVSGLASEARLFLGLGNQPINYTSRGAWAVSTNYSTYDLAIYSGVVYSCQIPHSSGVFSADLAAGKWVIHQGMTREELAAGSGSQLVSFTPSGSGVSSRSTEAKLRTIVDISDRGAKGDGTTNDMPALLAARADGVHIRFRRLGGAPTTYYFGAFTAGDLDGLILDVEPGVTLSFAANAPYSLYKNIKFWSDTKVYFRDISVYYVFPKTQINFKREYIPPVDNPFKRKSWALNCTTASLVSALSVAFPSGDTFSAAAATTASDSVSITDTTSGYFRGAFVDLGPYETISAYFDSGVSPGVIGVMVRGTTGYAVVYSNGSGNYYTAFKPTGSAIQGNTADLAWSLLGQGSYDSFKPENSVWSATRVGNDVIVKVNGHALTAPVMRSVGSVVQVGFVCQNTAAFSVSGMTLERRPSAVYGAQVIDEIRIFGDSTAESFPGSWDGYLKPMLEGQFGLQINSVSNYAVVGETLAQQYARMTANGLGSAPYVIVCAGTNNIQMTQSLSSFKTDVSNILTYISSNGRKAVIVIPWLWYTQAQSGGVGQASANYAAGAPYRMAMERLALAAGAIIVKTPEELPNPSPALLSSQPDMPLLRDNIHQDDMAHQLYAQAICRAIIDDYISHPDAVEQSLPTAWFKNGAADSDIRVVVAKSGVVSVGGTMTVSTITNGTQILQLPRYAWPTRTTNIPAIALSSGGASVLGSCYLAVSTSGVVTISLAPASTVVLVFNASYKSVYSA